MYFCLRSSRRSPIVWCRNQANTPQCRTLTGSNQPLRRTGPAQARTAMRITPTSCGPAFPVTSPVAMRSSMSFYGSICLRAYDNISGAACYSSHHLSAGFESMTICSLRRLQLIGSHVYRWYIDRNCFIISPLDLQNRTPKCSCGRGRRPNN